MQRRKRKEQRKYQERKRFGRKVDFLFSAMQNSRGIPQSEVKPDRPAENLNGVIHRKRNAKQQGTDEQYAESDYFLFIFIYESFEFIHNNN